MTIRVLLADDHIMVRDALAGMLRAEADIEFVGVASNGLEAVTQTQLLRPDVVVLDVSMPEMNGIEAAACIRKAVPACRVLALSALGDACFVNQMVEAGAKGYVVKSESVNSLVQAVRHVYAGGVWLPDSPPLPLRANRTLLSRREREVLGRIAAGRRASQIAEELGVAVKTIDTYRRRMMHKLGLQSQTELVRYAVALGEARVGPLGDEKPDQASGVAKKKPS
jgi:DNA-binding NarL/FixJ family response regulator